MTSGIYMLISISGRRYIGSSHNIENRIKLHFRNLRGNRHQNIFLQHDFNKYRKMEYEILMACSDDLLLKQEQRFIDELKPELNLCLVAGSTLGTKMRPESKEKLSQARKGKTSPRKGARLSDETKNKLRKQHIGLSHSEETKSKMKASSPHRKWTDKQRKALSEKRTGNYRQDYFKCGHPFVEENIYRHNNTRTCRQCIRNHVREYRLGKKQKGTAEL